MATEYRILGQTGIAVSRLCFGALTIGPLQANLAVAEGADVIRSAIDLGVNFIDTAELYGTYPQIRLALAGAGHEVLVATKSYAYTREGMKESVETARRELGLPQIGIFMMHEQETRLTLAGHREALMYLVEAKARGIIRAVGVSTHAIEVVEAAAAMPEIDVIHPLLNRRGIGILDGGAEAMLAAIGRAAAAGKGIYGMKPLGGGNLIGEAPAALAFVRGRPELAAVAVGMKTTLEVELNAAVFSGEAVPAARWEEAARLERHLHIEDWCVGCGACVRRCPQGALTLADGQARVDRDKCLRCGYCSTVCRDFCLKIV